MKTVTRAMRLLQSFSDGESWRPLGELASAAGIDKATARRMLLALCEVGLIEQDARTRHYSIGPAVLPLARARQNNRPLLSIVKPAVQRIWESLNETTHFSMPARDGLAVACVAESTKAMRVALETGHILPMTTSGSGIAFLSASQHDVIERYLQNDLPRFTELSLVSPQAVDHAIREARRLGYAHTSQTFEMGVCGIAVPVRDFSGQPVGSLAVAMPLSRFSEDLKLKVAESLLAEAGRLTSQI